MASQDVIDQQIRAYYGGPDWDEGSRLTSRSAQGGLEFVRTQELIAERIPVGSRVADIGGATGVHAASLADAGHQVTLLDPVIEQVEQARAYGTFEALVGDARGLPIEDSSVDVALLLGPLYHLAERADRLRALEEATRVVRSGGWVFAAAIPRLARLAALSGGAGMPRGWEDLIEHGTSPAGGRFPGGHFHTSAELVGELSDAGMLEVEVVGVEGPAGLALEQLAEADEDLRRAALTLARAVGGQPGVQEISNHLLAIGRRP
ncbi:bifunctional 2-polyprenyl-6-hydroxyphenol methylase/3-demethylubiquinol 3-O-methyltransferase UbiG [Nocardioides sp.]|uniref:class I SAM-dependent methyltransferase n=1 Tax=Nocardioides sp. TaxID=35761 RepID=UPI0019BA2AED|nr:class I SAM-dependent methyltransferase [Nocardioides sp.]MBC7278984.1 class I SAM-dependent methyltransferase [Nocardioides sp.]